MQTQIHKIIKTDAKVCLTNSENKYTDKSDIKNYWGQLYNRDSQHLHRADDSRQEETVAATTELSLFTSRCIKP